MNVVSMRRRSATISCSLSQTYLPRGSFFLGPVGLRDDFFRFPIPVCDSRGRRWCRRESVHVTLASLVELSRGYTCDLSLSAAMATRSKSRVRLPPSSSSLPSASTSMAPPPARTQARPPSVMNKANTLQRSGTSDHIPDPQLRATASAKPQDPENNIKVVIRCRRRSEREVNDASPIVVQMDGAKSQDISIETSVPTSSLGVVTLPPTRKYPFDVVFGPEASQELVYDEVVQPMLEEVLQGYNCTLFAYGQTGTGKTYVFVPPAPQCQPQLIFAFSHTMQGDLVPTPMGNPSMGAGMIPRVLFRLFHELETSNADYSVKISYVELYNEELRDLLAPELAAPSGSTQPMAQGVAKEAPVLKIFDDSSKKGVFIQGLDDCPVKDRADALALLTKGSQRRQIAATKFNDHSSRSHSIFTITVHVKETSSIGDDLLKVGKLNLVDLAGSENIGRSGAENKRAREAGMINQSLLTLGRVINALVDKSSHVPYRYVYHLPVHGRLTRISQGVEAYSTSSRFSWWTHQDLYHCDNLSCSM